MSLKNKRLSSQNKNKKFQFGVYIILKALTTEQQTAAARLTAQQQQQQPQIIIQAQQQQQQSTASGSSTAIHQATTTSYTTATTASVQTSVKTTTNVVISGSPVATTTVKARIGGTLTVQEARASGASVVSVASLPAGQRITAANLVATAAGQAAVSQKSIIGVTVGTGAGAKTLTPAQLQYYRYKIFV